MAIGYSQGIFQPVGAVFVFACLDHAPDELVDVLLTVASIAALDKNGRRDYYAENYEYYKDKEITNAMLVGALVPAVASCAASFQLAMSAEATAAWFMSAAGLANGVEILDMEYST